MLVSERGDIRSGVFESFISTAVLKYFHELESVEFEFDIGSVFLEFFVVGGGPL